jgi:glycosyltransferase involved in cell wall biosynthesis
MNARPRILVYYGILAAKGGADGVAAWMLEALREEFDVTLLTWKPVDLARLNTIFGTSLRNGDFQIRTVPFPIRKLIELDPDQGSIQKHAWLMRVSKRIRPQYDLVVSADNEGDFGPPALQYVHWPFLAHVRNGVRPSCDLPLRAKLAAIRRRQIRPWMLLADFSFDRVKRNSTLANSDWTARWVEREYGIPSVIVHPPAAGVFPEIPFERREDGFIMVGRFTPSKRPDWVIRVLDRVRAAHPRLRLHLVGTVSDYPGDRGYFESLQPLLREHGAWVTLHVDLPRESLAWLMASLRYGIHAYEEEHFGMTVAEMLAAGCIPFVHDSGSPPEIVGGDSRLLYTDADDAAARISTLLANPAEQRDVLARLAPRRNSYQPEAFMAAIRREVRQAAANRGRCGNGPDELPASRVAQRPRLLRLE